MLRPRSFLDRIEAIGPKIMGDFIIVVAIAAAAGLASPLGGYLAFVSKPSSLMLSIAVGLASGLLLGTFAFEMLPEAIAQLPIVAVVICFVAGFGAIYWFDLYLNRGKWRDRKPRSGGRWSGSTCARSRAAPW